MKLYISKRIRIACLTSDTVYPNSKDLAKRTISDNILKGIPYEITIINKDDGYQRGLASMVHKFFGNKTGSGTNVNEVIARELQETVIKRLNKRKSIPGLRIILGSIFRGNSIIIFFLVMVFIIYCVQ